MSAPTRSGGRTLNRITMAIAVVAGVVTIAGAVLAEPADVTQTQCIAIGAEVQNTEHSDVVAAMMAGRRDNGFCAEPTQSSPQFDWAALDTQQFSGHIPPNE